ncbi:GNAT family N-acetyltransferase [Butyrivibrio sp. AE3006]|uniref:GNAT family N-acetyltransferase n=1 Tax=Butyrivibrio sp. AE3006 TaxID=1280673 RepID=UPI00040A29C4|nr:GNAT family N-acetyltransferase [Butyrivibrio sp. AE3006]
MDYCRISSDKINELWELQKAYKNEIGEDAPSEQDMKALGKAIEREVIEFYGAFDGDKLAGCCSVTKGFSTFNYAVSGVFEDFYITPKYRHSGIARELVSYAYAESKVGSLTVGCADCDVKMYEAIGFSISLGNMLAYE